jgi:hypothetical protein
VSFTTWEKASLQALHRVLERHLAPRSRTHRGHRAHRITTAALAGGAFNIVTGAGETIQTLNGAASLASTGLEAAEFATGVGGVKFAYDAVTYLGAAAGCALNIIH